MSDDPQTHFDTGEMITALCLWEAWIDIEVGKSEELADVRRTMAEMRDGHGSFTMRAAIVHLTRDCDAAWRAAEALNEGSTGAFDFDFCPEFLVTAIRGGLMAQAIEIEYTPRPRWP